MLVHTLEQLTYQDEDHIKEWIRTYGINKQDERGKTLLMHSVSSVLTPNVTACLLKMGADVNISDNTGQTALDVFEHTMKGRISIARFSSQWVPQVSESFSQLMLKMLALDVSGRSYPAMRTVLVGQKGLKSVADLIENRRYREALELSRA